MTVFRVPGNSRSRSSGIHGIPSRDRSRESPGVPSLVTSYVATLLPWSAPLTRRYRPCSEPVAAATHFVGTQPSWQFVVPPIDLIRSMVPLHVFVIANRCAAPPPLTHHFYYFVSVQPSPRAHRLVVYVLVFTIRVCNPPSVSKTHDCQVVSVARPFLAVFAVPWSFTTSTCSFVSATVLFVASSF